MKTKLTLKETLAVASMLFGLFFGAGNLIFPVHMGQLAGSKALIAAAGFIATGVGLPLLGVAAMGSSRSEGLFDMASRVGKGWSLFFTCALYLTIGPFFAIPRCATTSFTVGIEPMLAASGSSLWLPAFSVFFFALVLIFSLKPGKILMWVGKVINPVFLTFLGLLLLLAFVRPMGMMGNVVPDPSIADNTFFNGFLEGYNTMDALASIAFGIIIIRVVRELGVSEPAAIAKCTLKAGVFCCILMGTIYALITLMGAQSRGVLDISDNGGIALAQIAAHYFGKTGQLLLAIMVFLACLKTAIGLVTSCAETFEQLFPKITYKKWAVIFTILPLVISNVGLTVLISYAVPVLMFLYPLAITLILMCLFGGVIQYDKRVFISVTAFTSVAAFFDLLRTLPDDVQTGIHADIIVHAVSKFLPLYDLGIGWGVPALIGLFIGMIVRFHSEQLCKK